MRILGVVVIGGVIGATLVRMAPGFGVDAEELDTRLSRQSIQALRESNSAHESTSSFYVEYFARLMRGDLGISQTLQRPVSQLFRERFPETLKSVGVGLLFGWVTGFSLALLLTSARAWYLDVFASIAAGIVLCLPAAVIALLFIWLQAPAMLVLGLIIFPNVFRYSRGLLSRSASAPHIITAKAKGVGDIGILFRHILPTIAPQLLALAAVSVSIAFTAAIPVEALCDLPGIGQLAWQAALGRDIALLINITMIVTLITVMANSASDLIGKGWGRATV